MLRLGWLLLAVIVLAAARPAAAVEPNEMLKDPALEARAREISRELRCVVCQNESIDESEADLAHDLRVLVRERLVAGDSDQQVLQFVVDRYGDFVLYKPPVESKTWLLWFGPFALLAGGALIVLAINRRVQGRPATTAPLDEKEKDRASKLLNDDEAN